MKKTLWLASTTLVAAAMLTAPAYAGGKSKSDMRDQEIQELKARLDRLERESEDEKIVQASRVQALAEEQEATKKAMKGWWSDTKISGRMYYDVTAIDNQHNGIDDANNGVSFDFKRFYIGVDHKFNDIFSGNLTTDANFRSQTGEVEVFVKKAYLQAKFSNAFTARLGSADMPWVPFAEDAYGYRWIENTLIDRTKFGTSADWGVHVFGNLADKTLGYAVSVVNGASYRNPSRTDSMDVEGRVNLNVSDLTFAVGGYYGQLGAKNNVTTFNDATRWNALAAYKKDGVRLGVEYFVANDYAFVTAAGSSKAEGYSGFGSYQFDPQWSVFGKYEFVKPFDEFSTSAAREAFENTYYNIGISYSPVKIVDFALVYKHDEGNNGFFSDSNGTIGGTAFAQGNDGEYDEIGLFGQFRW